MSEANYADQLAQVRQRRRAKAEKLRDQGLSYRQIANRLGVSHPTVLADLNVRQRTRAELVDMTPTQIVAAYRAGELSELMSGRDPQTADTEEGDAA